MKLTTQRLKKLIKEEFENILKESGKGDLYYSELKAQFPDMSEEEINKIVQIMLKQGKKNNETNK